MDNNGRYQESLRPRFHFTARESWLNDPNGCVFCDGEYHLFFQHNPSANEWGNMTWGHAVSPDLVHWQQLAHAIHPYGGGTIFSGTAVVDEANTSGLGEPGKPAMVALFSHARPPHGQALAFSIDKGRTWRLYQDGKHVIPNQGLDEGERDPKVFWHEPSGKWILVLWVRHGTMRLFASANLRQWTHLSDFNAPGLFECPDMFELAVDSSSPAPGERKWVLYDAAFNYWIGSFDGREFRPEAGPLRGEYGASFYAAQSWNHTPGRVVQIAWMRGGTYPGMPFNQQMSFPCELSLRRTDGRLRLCRTPVPEIEKLYGGTSWTLTNRQLEPGQANPLEAAQGEAFDLEMLLAPSAGSAVGLRLYDQTIRWAQNTITCLGQSAPVSPAQGALKLRLLVDRTSIELFANDGEISMSSCFVPSKPQTGLEFYAEGGPVRIQAVKVRTLRSAWQMAGEADEAITPSAQAAGVR